MKLFYSSVCHVAICGDYKPLPIFIYIYMYIILILIILLRCSKNSGEFERHALFKKFGKGFPLSQSEMWLMMKSVGRL